MSDDENLSGQQISDTLNFIIYSALIPILKNTGYLDKAFSQIFYQMDLDKRRKITAIELNTLQDLMFTYLTNDDYKIKIDIIKRMQLERDLYYNIISIFLAECEGYLLDENQIDGNSRKRMEFIEKRVYGDRKNLSATIKWVQGYLEVYLKFKEKILEKYYKYINQEAKRIYDQSEYSQVLQDIYENLIIAASKAIGRYNPNRGALKSYIQWWIMNVAKNPTYGTETGQSITLSGSGRRHMAAQYHKTGAISFAIPIDSVESILVSEQPTPEEFIDSENRRIKLEKAISKLDGVKWSVLMNSLPWHLSPEDVSKLKRLSAQSYTG